MGSSPPPDRTARRAAAARRRAQRRRQLALLGLAGLLVLALAVWAVAGGSGGGSSTRTARTSGSAAAPTTASTPSAASTTPATTTAATNPNAQITVAAVGDTMMGSPQLGLPSAGGKYLFSATKQYLKANVSIVDQEGTLTYTGPSKCGGGSSSVCFAFKSPPSYAANLTAAGFTVANLADNHTYDYGAEGLTNTVAALKRVGLPYTGLPAQFTVQHVGGTSVAILGFAPYHWCANSLDLPSVRSLVQKARRQANLVIVYFHLGTQGANAVHVGPGPEYVFGDPQGDVKVFAHTVIDAGAAMAIGTGPHVLRGIEFYKGHMIAYSLGNYLGYRGFGLGGNLSTSAVLQTTITAAGRFVTGRLRPMTLDGNGVPSPGGYGVSLVRTLSQQDFGRAGAHISTAGVISPPAG
jgi:poly-gamma-glutamate capsule biosynthesis protein CapA/YwtB (metallophosphatase superfamily)